MSKRNVLSLSPERLWELFDYNPLTGRLFWSRSCRPHLRGRAAGHLSRKHGYRTLKFDGVNYLVHRLVWVWCYGFNPRGEIDHSGQESLEIKLDQVWGLVDRTPREHRQVTSLNLCRRALPQGVHKNSSGSYTAYTSVSGAQVTLGTFPDPEEALAARKGAEKIIKLFS